MSAGVGELAASAEARRPHLVTVDDLAVYFSASGSSAKVRAVDGVSFHIDAGECLGLIGESGSGKTTIGQAILRLVDVTRGRVTFNGESLLDASSSRLKQLRRAMQIVFQDPHASLDPRRRIWQSLIEPLVVQDLGSPAEREERAERLLGRVGLVREEHGRRYPHELSGGQKQRVSIARALTLAPEFLVCDEPVSALDVSLQASIVNLLRELQREYRLALLFISHDLSIVKHIADRVAVLYLGKIMEIAPVERLLSDAMHPYTVALLSAIPMPRTDDRSRPRRIVLRGEVPSPLAPPSGCRFRTRCPYAEERCAAEEPVPRAVGAEQLVACHFAERIAAGRRPERSGPPRAREGVE